MTEEKKQEEQVRSEGPKSEGPKSEGPKAEGPKAEGPKAAEPKADAAAEKPEVKLSAQAEKVVKTIEEMSVLELSD